MKKCGRMKFYAVACFTCYFLHFKILENIIKINIQNTRTRKIFACFFDMLPIILGNGLQLAQISHGINLMQKTCNKIYFYMKTYFLKLKCQYYQTRNYVHIKRLFKRFWTHFKSKFHIYIPEINRNPYGFLLILMCTVGIEIDHCLHMG